MNNKTQVLTCGACAVIVSENGQMTTSVDMLVNGAKHIASMFGRQNSHRIAARA
ncbi:MAG: hypothetical protein J5804_02815 [Eggerthellaceae bacterium]|nr:hypothetical protein [Eggerthellaceae bacterium]